MNSIHDLGGMDGFGPVVRDEHVLSAWELRMQCLSQAARAAGLFNTDEFRHAIERLHPREYLGLDYHERWEVGIGRLLVEKGVLTEAELESCVSAFLADAETPVAQRYNAERTAQAFAWRSRLGVTRDEGPEVPPRFRVGEAVMVRNMHPRGHTRAPRYVRGKRGVIDRHYGAPPLADALAHGGRTVFQPLYAVRFEAQEVWGADYPGSDAVYVDLWESYLEPARA
ncbi:MAG: nitrile hydratase subunit beta [Chloroflexi bacterium]|nr:nitrile hydratase subunit beta [Chloroflexota bacterium]